MQAKKNHLELLAPAGNLEKMKTAFAHGADAVYLGIPDFSLRVRINDFNLETVKEGIDYGHKLNKKVYVTVNIFAHNRHLENLPFYIKKLKKWQADALIVSDPGIMEIIKELWPEASLHLSTQANCTNWRSAEFWYQKGVQRIILGRETSLSEIKEIKKRVPKVELEYFVHGAMCLAYSGRCLLSQYFLGRSANLGDCVQPCRWKYDVKQKQNFAQNNVLEINEENRPDQILIMEEEEHGSYILNSKDLCLLKYLLQLKEAGISSFKIEGRAKSVYYQALVNGIYRQALDLLNSTLSAKEKDKILNYLYNELETKLVHRGYTNGFLLEEKAGQNFDNSHQKSAWEFCGLVNKASDKDGIIAVKVHNTLKVGDTIEIVRPKYDIIKTKVSTMKNIKNNLDIKEAHGGGSGHEVYLKVKEKVPCLSVIRRKK